MGADISCKKGNQKNVRAPDFEEKPCIGDVRVLIVDYLSNQRYNRERSRTLMM